MKKKEKKECAQRSAQQVGEQPPRIRCNKSNLHIGSGHRVTVMRMEGRRGKRCPRMWSEILFSFVESTSSTTLTLGSTDRLICDAIDFKIKSFSTEKILILWTIRFWSIFSHDSFAWIIHSNVEFVRSFHFWRHYSCIEFENPEFDERAREWITNRNSLFVAKKCWYVWSAVKRCDGCRLCAMQTNWFQLVFVVFIIRMLYVFRQSYGSSSTKENTRNWVGRQRQQAKQEFGFLVRIESNRYRCDN